MFSLAMNYVIMNMAWVLTKIRAKRTDIERMEMYLMVCMSIISVITLIVDLENKVCPIVMIIIIYSALQIVLKNKLIKMEEENIE